MELPFELLAAWLDASDAPARAAVIAVHAPGLGVEGARALLDVAAGGPSYGGDRAVERQLQRDLLALARGVAEHQSAWPEAAMSASLLAADLLATGDLRGAWVELGAWRMAARRAGDHTQIAKACEQLGLLASRLGRAKEGDRYLAEAAALYGEDLDEPALARVLLARIALATAAGDIEGLAGRAADLASLRERTEDPELRAWIDTSWPH